MSFFKSLLPAIVLLLGTAALSADGGGPNTGTVAETMTVGKYVYVRLEEDGGWIAGPATAVDVGDEVMFSEGMMMSDFHSTSLDRDFESIRFVAYLKVAGAPEANKENTGAEDADGAVAGAATAMNAEAVAAAHAGIDIPTPGAAAEAPAAGEIEPLQGGRTIGGIFAASAELAGQPVTLRARVTKVSRNILGKNWITLQDGSGEAPNDKLVATSAQAPAVGELVEASGVLKNDVDLGAGYHYDVLLEEAVFTQ